MDDKNQSVVYSPYLKEPMPPVSSSRALYNAASLGLQPLIFIVTSGTDEQQAGVLRKTKRVTGYFEGTLASVEKQEQDWKVVGKTTKIDGQSDYVLYNKMIKV